MRYYEIVEARRNPEQNPKVSTLEELEKYAGRDDVFVSFTSDVGKMSHGNNGKNIGGSKLGINPKSEWDTPIGIYTYPVDYVLRKKGKVPFAEKEPFLYVVQPTKPLLDLNNYSETDFKRDSEKLIDMGFADTRNEGIKTAKFDTPAAHLWNWTRLAVFLPMSNNSSRASVQWPKILRSLGYLGAIDLGSGLIHPNEPIQAVFFSLDAVKVLEVIPNRFKRKPFNKSIKDIKNPSEKLKLFAVTRNGDAIMYIQNPSDVVQLAAVNQYGDAIRYINNPSDEVQLAAVNQYGDAIRYILRKDIIPSEQVQLAAVNQNGEAIRYILRKDITPSEAVQLAAVQRSIYAFEYIKNPSERVQLAVVQKNVNDSEYNGDAIKLIKNPSEKVQLAAVQKDARAIKYINNPSAAVKKAAGL